jgi:hypothetical protein
MAPIITPMQALERIEQTLRGTDAYHIAMDVPTCKVGLGLWIKRVIRQNKGVV